MEENRMDMTPDAGTEEAPLAPAELVGPIQPVEEADPAELAEPAIDPAELAALRGLYPDADPAVDMADPLFCGLLSGAVKPSLRQVYELCHREALTASAVTSAVDQAVAAALASAVPAAVAEAEENLLAAIRLHGARPSENGVGSPGAVVSHPSVDRLTRSERAALAYRAERGERIRL